MYLPLNRIVMCAFLLTVYGNYLHASTYQANASLLPHHNGKENTDTKQSPSDLIEEIPDLIIGDRNAPITLIEYSAINCVHCAKFHNNAFKELREKYIDTGEVRYIMRHFPLDYTSVLCMSLITTQHQTQWLDLIQKSYKSIGSWIKEGPEALAQVLELNVKLVWQSQEDLAMIDKIMAKRFNAEQQYEINATPAFVIRHHNEDLELINYVITQKELEQKLDNYIKLYKIKIEQIHK